ncbi:MAG: glycoside hydrolase family 88 protein [Marinilabiliales bacterium]|nr:glycoside hydrolase family 88 protein [Marinilabiliales bacterium]
MWQGSAAILTATAHIEYYIGEVIRENDPKGVGPFIMASLEYEMIQE